MHTRRGFLSLAGAGAAGLLLSRRAQGYAFPHSPKLAKFIQALPGLGPKGIPVATPKKSWGVDNYVISMQQYSQQLHPNLPATKLWGYADATSGSPVSRYLGPAIVAQRGTKVRVTYLNNLPSTHILPIDTTLPGAEPGQPANRAVPHLHGGFVHWTSDGGPMSWFTPGNAKVGCDFVSNVFEYPNDQSARLMWYHDHAMGTTRLNAYAGLAAPYILRDPFENLAIALGLLPSGDQEVPLIIQDKTFNSDGSLGYPNEYDKSIWAYGPDEAPPASVKWPNLPVPSCVPEFFGDTILVNGAVYPSMNVERRKYRFRILNGSQARFYNLQLYYAKTTAPAEADLTKPGPEFVQIGTEGGFLPAPVTLNKPPVRFSVQMNPQGDPIASTLKYTLLLAPAERADIIIDFADVPTGAKLILYNDAPAPFPAGDPANDYQTPTTGPNTRTLMQFTVTGNRHFSLLGLENFWAQLVLPTVVPWGATTVGKTLNEDFDDYGRLRQRQGTTTSLSTSSQGLTTYGLGYEDPATEVIKAGAVQVWNVYNLTMDTHPIHFHLANAKVLGRGPLSISSGGVFTPGKLRAPDANEAGFKETIRMNPNEVTQVLMQFDLPNGSAPVSSRTGGYNYVWHCHILEHEEHDMMRPLIIKP